MTRMTPAQYVAEKENAPGGGVAAPHATEGVQSTPNSQKETVMNKSNPAPLEIQIIGDGTPNTSRGTAHVWAENSTINIVLPDRFGTGSMLNFSYDDAANIAAELNLVLDEEATR